MKSICQFYHFFKKKLKKLYKSNRELENIFFLLATDVLKCDKTTLIIKMIQNKNIDFFFIKNY